jgi:hypothetical protein
MGTSKLSGAGANSYWALPQHQLVQGRGTIAKINPSQSTKNIALGMQPKIERLLKKTLFF